MACAAFAYIQARLQARHGERPTGNTWRQLSAAQHLAHFLQVARDTPLRPWVLGLNASTPVHDIEALLHKHYYRYISQVAGWQPTPWRAATEWIRELLMLPMLQSLFSEGEIPPWVARHRMLVELAQSKPGSRVEMLEQTPWWPLKETAHQGRALHTGWFGYWQSLWPPASRSHIKGMNELVTTILLHLTLMQSTNEMTGNSARKALAEQLSIMFRRHTQEPVAAFIHLVLVALDLERVRGEILLRHQFPGFSQQVS